MAKQDVIKHYRQAGETAAPASLPYGELAIAKDGTLYAGNEEGVPVSRVEVAGKSEQLGEHALADLMLKETYDPDKKGLPYIPRSEAMEKKTYDADGDGVVDSAKQAETAASAENAVKLGGKSESEWSVANAAKAADSDKVGGKALSMSLSGTTLTITYQ